MVKIMTFASALEDADAHSPEKTLLLGNGFSIDYNAKIFTYDSLATEAKLSGLSVEKNQLFAALASTNFEVVIDKLKAGASLERLYGGDSKRAERMERDARLVRNGLADVLAERHPVRAHDVDVEEIEHARTFLSHFGFIFTVNYDLLLYWLINAREYGPRVVRTDGFEWPTFKDRSRLIWKRKPSRMQRIYFLHGALHLFVEDRRLRKLSFGEHGPLVESLRERLDAGDYPLVVTEGTREEKEARIDRSTYLRTALRRFGEVDGALFVHGVSMSRNDDHIIERIESETSNITGLYVGVHGSKRSAGARELIDRATEIAKRREKVGGRPLRLRFYDSASAHVWRG